MTSKLWEGTTIESIAAEIWDKPACRIAYYLGQIDYTVHDLFGVLPEDTDIPEAARELAQLMLGSLMGTCDQELAMAAAEKIVGQWRAARVVN